MAKEPEIRVRGVSETLKQELLNIARNQGIKLSDFLKPKLREIRDSFPKELRTPPRED